MKHQTIVLQTLIGSTVFVYYLVKRYYSSLSSVYYEIRVDSVVFVFGIANIPSFTYMYS
jgi:hypothetical protein